MADKRAPLNTRLEPRRFPVLADEDRRSELAANWIREDHLKLLLLCDELGVAEGPDRFYNLALALARKHYFGFQERTPAKKWTDLVCGYLVVEIERLTKDKRKNPGHSATWAADVLAKRPEWKSFLGENRSDGGEALRVRYQSFKKTSWAKAFRAAFRIHEHDGTLDQWKRDMLEAIENPHP